MVKDTRAGKRPVPPTKGQGIMGEWITYIPEWDGNRDTKNPVTVEILPLTVRETKRISKNIEARRVKGGGFKTNQADISERTFLSHLRNITHLKENGKPITNAEELLDSYFIDLANEIEEAISDISILDEGDIKNFESRSDGFLERKHGTATTARKKEKKPGTAEETTV